MRVGVVGGGILGLTLANRLHARGADVEVFEAGSQVGGLSTWCDYGEFVWDRFYHCILPQDAHTLALIEDLGLTDELRWTKTGTGYFGDGRCHSMSSTWDFARFPLLSLFQKFRLGLGVVRARRTSPAELADITAAEWLASLCGQATFERFWAPLLRAKLGPYWDHVAATYMWATVNRLFGARQKTTHSECLGYVRGGYRTILERLAQRVTVHTDCEVAGIDEADGSCRVTTRDGGDREFDQVFFTGPTGAASRIANGTAAEHVADVAHRHPAGGSFLGVISVNLVLREPLTPFYVLNIADPDVELTGVIETTNLIARDQETAGRSLVYLPRYVPADELSFEHADEELLRRHVDHGLKRLFPSFDESLILTHRVHRARYVQPLPMVGDVSASPPAAIRQPFQVLNSSMLTCATLNNDEIVELADRAAADTAFATAIPAK